MNPPPSHGATAIVQQPVGLTDSKAATTEVSGDTGVSPNASEGVLGDSGVPVSLETVLRKQMEEFRTRSLAENTANGQKTGTR